MTNDEAQMTSEIQRSNDKKVYDLGERTARFGEDIIDFVKTLPRDRINMELVGQIVRSATSVGANYAEADCAGTKKKFRYKINICRTEAKESKYWLRMIERNNLDRGELSKGLSNEAQELVLIFSSIYSSSKQ